MKYERFKKTRAYKTAQVFNNLTNYIILISGFLIIFGAIYGIHDQGIYEYHYGVKTINIEGIFAAFTVSIVGLVIVVFTYINHRNNN